MPGASITIAEPKAFDDDVTASAVGSEPTLTTTGSGNNFLSATLDLVGVVLAVLDDTIAPGISALDGSYNFDVGSLSYSLLSLPLTAGLKLGQTLTLTPEGITASMKEMVGGTQIGSTQTGALGTVFSFIAPQSGSGQLQIDATYTATFQISASTGIVGDISLSINGPQISGSFLGIPFSAGPLGTYQFFDDSTGIGAIGNPSTSTNAPTASAVYNINYAMPDTADVAANGSFLVDDLTAYGNGDIVMGDDSTLIFPADDTANSDNFSFGANVKILIDGNANFTMPSTSVWYFYGDIVNGGASPANLNLEGGGQYWFLANLSYTGKTHIESDSILVFDFANGLTGDVSIDGGSQLWLAKSAYTLGSLEGAGIVSDAGPGGATVLTVGGDNLSTTFSGTFEEVFSRSLGLTKVGTGSFELTGATLYNGPTTVDNGNFALGGLATTLAGDVTVNAPGILRVLNSASLGSLAGSGNVLLQNINGNALTVGTDNASTTYSGELNDTLGTGNLVKAGLGTFVLTNNEGYHGTTTVAGGVLEIESNGASSVTASLTSTAITVDLNTALAYAVADKTDNQYAVNAVITGAGLVFFSGPDDGVTTLYQASSYTGGTYIESGIVDVGNNSALGTGVVQMDGGALRATGSPKTLANNFNLAGAIGFGAATNIAGTVTLLADTSVSGSENAGNDTWSGAVSLGAFNLIMSDLGPNTDGARWAGQSLTISGAISGTGGVANDSGGTLVLSGDDTYSGGTEVGAGATLSISGAHDLGSGPLALQAGSTLQLNGAGVAYGNAVALKSGAATIDVNFDFNSPDHFSGLVGGAGGLYVSGVGELALDHANTYTGGTTVNASRIAADDNSALGTGTLRLDDAFIDLDHSKLADAIALEGADTLFVYQGEIATLNGIISDGANSSGAVAGGFLATGGGTLVLTGANTYSGGTTVDSGTTLSISAGDNIGAGALTLDGGSTLDMTAALSLNNAIVLNGAASLGISNAFDFLYGQITGAGSLSISGGGGFYLINSANSFTGGIIVNNELLVVYGSGVLGAGAVTIEGGANIDFVGGTYANAINIAGVSNFNVNPTGAATPSVVTLNGIISDGASAGALSVQGANGTLALGGADNYSGGTTINSGATLEVSGAGSLGTGGVTLQSGGTLTIDAGAAPAITGAATLHGALIGAGKWQQNSGSLTLASGVSLTIASWSSKATAINVQAAVSYGGTFYAGAASLGEAINLSGAGLALSGASTFAGTALAGSHALTNSGTATLSGLTIGGTATFYNTGTAQQSALTTIGDAAGDIADLTNSASGTYDITNDTGIARGPSTASLFTNSGLFEKTGGTGTSSVQADLTSTGTITAATGAIALLGPNNNISGTINGAGTLSFAGGASQIKSGTTVSVAALTATGANTSLIVAENLAYSGAFSDLLGATLYVSSGDTLTLSGATTLAGKISGPGTLAISGGTADIIPYASISGPNITVTGASTTLALGENLAFTRTFSVSSGATLNLTGGTLTLFGSNSFNDAIVKGSHTLWLSGPSSVTGLTIGGTALLYNANVLTESAGSVTVGDSSGSAATLLNAAAGTYDLLDDSGVGLGSSAASSMSNYGLFEKTGGSGESVIAPKFLNGHNVLDSSGTLDFQAAVTGTGTDTISGAATLEFDSTVASSQKILFQGAGSTLDLTDWGGFSGSLSGFDANGASNDAIDVSAPWAFVGFNQSTGMMTFADGGTQHAVKLTGSYIAADFHTQTVGGATQVTYG